MIVGFIIFIISFMILIVAFPECAFNGAMNGLTLCGNVIIPSLYPFTLCVLFLIKSNIFIFLKKFNKIIFKLFNFDYEVFVCFIFSFLGGYPVGAMLLNEVYKKRLNKSNATLLLCSLINAGPTYIISFIGIKLLGSKKIGFIILFSIYISSLLLTLILTRFLKPENNTFILKPKFPICDCFVESASDAAKTLINICGFIVFFSAVNSIICSFSEKLYFLSYLPFIIDISSTIYKIDNIYLFTFLLGFGGISVWCQIFALSRNIKKKIIIFISIRILHGTLSTVLTYIIMNVFSVEIKTLSNTIIILPDSFYSSATVTTSIILMTILFIISMQKRSGKLSKDML